MSQNRKNTFDRFCDHNMLYIVSQCLHFLVYLPIFIIVDIYKTKSNIYVCDFVNLFIFLLLIIWIIQQGHFCLIILNIHFKVLSHICTHIIILYYVYYITIDIIFLIPFNQIQCKHLMLCEQIYIHYLLHRCCHA